MVLGGCQFSEVIMAKRRNPKKEKAQRNQAYARKFRKKKNTGFFSKRYSSKFTSGNNQNSNDQSEESTGAGAVEEQYILAFKIPGYEF